MAPLNEYSRATVVPLDSVHLAFDEITTAHCAVCCVDLTSYWIELSDFVLGYRFYADIKHSKLYSDLLQYQLSTETALLVVRTTLTALETLIARVTQEKVVYDRTALDFTEYGRLTIYWR